MNNPTRPLQGYRILDLTIFWAGPLASMIFADLGAEVIKVEAPQRLDPFRSYGVPSGVRKMEPEYECSPLFNAPNRNKLGLTLNLAHERGRAVFHQLVKISDAVVTNFTPRVLYQLGFDYETLRKVKPEIVLTSISGFGDSGPWRDYLSFAAIGEALSGMNSLIGYRGEGPLMNCVGSSDPYTGITAALVTLAAIRRARRSGVGCHIEVAQLEATIPFIADALMEYMLCGRVRSFDSPAGLSAAPYGTFPTAGRDQWIALSIRTDEQWRSLVEAMNFPQWVKQRELGSALERTRNLEWLNERVAEWTASQDKEALVQKLQEKGIPCAPVRTPSELLSDPQFKATGFFQSVDHPYAGRHPYASLPATFDGQRAPITRVGPLVGQDNRYVLCTLLGLSDQEFEELERLGITGPPRL